MWSQVTAAAHCISAFADQIIATLTKLSGSTFEKSVRSFASNAATVTKATIIPKATSTFSKPIILTVIQWLGKSLKVTPATLNRKKLMTACQILKTLANWKCYYSRKVFHSNKKLRMEKIKFMTSEKVWVWRMRRNINSWSKSFARTINVCMAGSMSLLLGILTRCNLRFLIRRRIGQRTEKTMNANVAKKTTSTCIRDLAIPATARNTMFFWDAANVRCLFASFAFRMKLTWT